MVIYVDLWWFTGDLMVIYGDLMVIYWLVVYLPLRKIWVRQLGWYSQQMVKQKMFQTTNQIKN